VTPAGTIKVVSGAGFGYALDHDYIREITVHEEALG